jgi:hypothetical protein
MGRARVMKAEGLCKDLKESQLVKHSAARMVQKIKFIARSVYTTDRPNKVFLILLL